MDVFLDCEFIDSGKDQKLKLISIGLVKANGDSYHAVSADFSEDECSNWVKKNVLTLIEEEPRKPRAQICNEILNFMQDITRPRFIGWYSAYDWVLFCQLFGGMLQLPAHWPQYCLDIRQYIDLIQNMTDIHPYVIQATKPPKPVTAHNAVTDAYWTRDFWNNLQGLLELWLQDKLL